MNYCKQCIPLLERTYRNRMGTSLNLSQPKTFTEKVQWLKIYDSTYLKTFCSDKITLHNYCTKKLGHDICIPMLYKYKHPSEIKFDSLPNGVVFKCNHGSGYNIICKPNTPIYRDKICSTLLNWLSQDFSTKNGSELHYKLIPHQILIEPYMNDGNFDLIDYKFYCFNGNPIFCQVITDRNTSEHISHYTTSWEYEPKYDWTEFDSVPNLEKPEFFDTMLEYSRILSVDFKLVRVDFYVINHALYLGELTFTPNSGFHHFKNPNTDMLLGEMLKL